MQIFEEKYTAYVLRDIVTLYHLVMDPRIIYADRVCG